MDEKLPEIRKQISALEEDKNPNHKIIEVVKLCSLLNSDKNGVEESQSPQTQAWLIGLYSFAWHPAACDHPINLITYAVN